MVCEYKMIRGLEISQTPHRKHAQAILRKVGWLPLINQQGEGNHPINQPHKENSFVCSRFSSSFEMKKQLNEGQYQLQIPTNLEIYCWFNRTIKCSY